MWKLNDLETDILSLGRQMGGLNLLTVFGCSHNLSWKYFPNWNCWQQATRKKHEILIWTTHFLNYGYDFLTKILIESLSPPKKEDYFNFRQLVFSFSYLRLLTTCFFMKWKKVRYMNCWTTAFEIFQFQVASG